MGSSLQTARCVASLPGWCHLELGQPGPGPGSAIYPAGGLTSPSKGTTNVLRPRALHEAPAGTVQPGYRLLSKLHTIPASSPGQHNPGVFF